MKREKGMEEEEKGEVEMKGLKQNESGSSKRMNKLLEKSVSNN